MISAAGVLLRSAKGTVLFLKRGQNCDFPNTWCLPGGHVEDGENAEKAAIREVKEETGFDIDGVDKVLSRRVANECDFTTFLKRIDAEFIPTLNDEHVAYAWAPMNEPPEPLHPGVVISLKREGMDELQVAQAMVARELTSPQRVENVSLFDMRITGTGVAYRRAINEFVYRRPENYLTPEFLQRCNGLPVIWMHPKSSTLNSEEFSDRIVGTMMLPYIMGDEVWGVAKIFDDAAIEAMTEDQLSTSPAVVFRDPSVNSKMQLEDGSMLLIEGKPSLLDHLAICEVGVWDKGEEPYGIRTDSQQEHIMTEEEKKALEAAEAKKSDKAKKDAEEIADKARKDAEEEDRKKADAAEGEKLDKILSHLDSMAKRMDSFEKRVDAMSDEPEELAADASEEDKEKHKADKVRRADKARKDAEDKEREEEEAAKKADSAETVKRIAELEKRLPKLEARMTPVMSDADHLMLADAQARADSVYNQFGKRAPRPLDGESADRYRRRVVTELKSHSPSWKEIDAGKLDNTSFEVVEKQVFADAEMAAINPVDLREDELRAVTTIDQHTGLRSTKFLGKQTFIHQMSPTKNYVTKLNTDFGRHN